MESPLLFLTFLLHAATASNAQPFDPRLVGTWSTKSNSTLTGPGFYNPIRDRLIEPENTGISYGFTDDGRFEAAYYRAISDPTNPQCTEGMLQWQHGTYTHLSNGSLFLDPIAVDGRQLLSAPCVKTSSVYTRFNQTELYERYEVLLDPYHNALRLNLFKFDGTPMPAMYLAFRPPQMLPTTTLNPTTTTTNSPGPTGASSSTTLAARAQKHKHISDVYGAARSSVKRDSESAAQGYQLQMCYLFRAGVVLTSIGGVLVLSSCVHTILQIM